MSSTKLKTANIVSLDASKLTGVMPAISGANLTGVSPFTVSASDPLITTNPAGGLGTIWMNSTSLDDKFLPKQLEVPRSVEQVSFRLVQRFEGNIVPSTPKQRLSQR